MSYKHRLLLFFLIDLILIISSFSFSFWLLNETNVISSSVSGLIGKGEFAALVLFSVIYFLFIYLFRLHRIAWEHKSANDTFQLLLAAAFGMGIIIVLHLSGILFISIRRLLLFWIVFSMLISASRMFWTLLLIRLAVDGAYQKRTLIVGAGVAGTMLVRHFNTNKYKKFHPVAFIDDNPRLQKLKIYGVPVAGTTKDIERIVNKLQIEHIIIAIPSLKKQILKEIVERCVKTSVKTQTMPMLEDIIEGKRAFNEVRDIQFEDLLGRDPVILDDECISNSIVNKVVLVTGAGGSIGSEICRQIAKFKPAKIILLGHGENSIYHIDMEMRGTAGDDFTVITEIADIKDFEKILAVIGNYQPDIIYHAAAHKHVHLMEGNPEEAIKNNVIGTKNLAEAAHIHKVDHFVMISTDKAVNPTGVMGSSKRLAEMIIQDFSEKSQTKFVAVRFGNVLGSRGSVIPLFIQQIQNGGPVTVTHPDMVRYFMTIPEAARLVMQAGALSKGGEIFILDMGEPVKIVDLVHHLIRLYGYRLDEIKIKYTGIRPGEKMFEELLTADEMIDKKVHSNIYIGKASSGNIAIVNQLLANYKAMSKEELRNRLLEIANSKDLDSK